VTLEDDVPILLVWGYELTGQAQPVEEHVDYFRIHGKIREKPLCPTNSPLKIYERVTASYRWLYANQLDVRALKHQTGLQLLSLLSSVIPNGEDSTDFECCTCEDADNWWRKSTAVLSGKSIRWDKNKDLYTFADGTALPPIPKKLYRREIWRLDTGAGEARLIAERVNRKHISVTLERHARLGDELAHVGFEVFLDGDPTRPVATVSTSDVSGSDDKAQSSSHSITVKVQEGQKIRVVLTGEKGKGKSRVMAP
jgi:hypothetical protein